MIKKTVGWVVIDPKTNAPARTGTSYSARTGKVYSSRAKALSVASYRGYPKNSVKEAFIEVEA